MDPVKRILKKYPREPRYAEFVVITENVDITPLRSKNKLIIGKGATGKVIEAYDDGTFEISIHGQTTGTFN